MKRPARRIILRILKIILISLSTLLVFTLFTVGIAYYFKDKLVYVFISEANKYVKVKIDVAKIRLELWSTFPDFSIHFTDIHIKESVPGSKVDFASAKSLYVAYSFKDLLDKKYAIKKLYLEDAQIHFKFFKDGRDNFSIFKASTSEYDDKSIIFKLQDIRLRNVQVKITDYSLKNEYDLFTQSLDARFTLSTDFWDVRLGGDVYSNYIKLDKRYFLKQKPGYIQGELTFTSKDQKLTINQAVIRIQKGLFTLDGYSILQKGNESIDIAFSQKNSDFRSITSMLPSDLAAPLANYKSAGDVYFNGYVRGPLRRGLSPEIYLSFGSQNASFRHPQWNEGLENVYFKGEYKNTAGKPGSISYFHIDTIYAVFNQKKLTGHFRVDDLVSPYLDIKAKSEIDATKLLTLFPNKAIKSMEGIVDFDIVLKGKESDFKTNKYQALTTGGKINLKDFGIKLYNKAWDIKNARGKFTFSKGNLLAEDFQTQIGNSDLQMQGILTNVIHYFLFPNEALRIQANIQSNNLYMEELLETTDEESNKPYALLLPEDIEYQIDTKINALHFRRLNPKMVSGRFAYKNKVLHISKWQGTQCGGKLHFNSELKQGADSVITATFQVEINNFPIDSLFYIAEEFNQKFITSANLRGRLSAKVDAGFKARHTLDILKKSVSAKADIEIQEGQLVNFEPMQNLSKFIDEDYLKNIRFSELKNTFYIDNATTYIPEMKIKSNINTIEIQGSHTFDNDFEYRLKVPVKNYKKKNIPDQLAQSESEQKGQLYVYLILKGNPDNFTVSYDKTALIENVKKRWQEEKQEIQNMFKKNYEKNKLEKTSDRELNEDELLDF